MEPSAVTTEQAERELRRIGRRVASSLDVASGRAIPAARRRLFDEEPASAGLASRWVIGLAAVGAVAAIALALRQSPTVPGSDRHAATGGQASPGADVLPGIAPSEGSRSRIEPRPEGATELILESGDASGVMGPRTQGPRAVLAGPYRVTGDAELTVRWSDVDGLAVEVKSGEARILAPGRTPAIVPAGATKKLPAKP